MKKRQFTHVFPGHDVPRDAAVGAVENVCRTRAQVLLDDNQAGGRLQDGLAEREKPHELLVCQVAQAPLRPDEVVLLARDGLPLLQADVEDGAHAGLALQRGGELGNGLHDVDVLGDAEEQALCHSADPVCSVSPGRGRPAGFGSTHPAPPSRVLVSVRRSCFVPMPNLARKVRDPWRSMRLMEEKPPWAGMPPSIPLTFTCARCQYSLPLEELMRPSGAVGSSFGSDIEGRDWSRLGIVGGVGGEWFYTF